DLADDDVGVGAVGRDDDGVRLLDARLAQEVGVHAVPDEEDARPVLAETRERVLVLVHDRNVPVLALELEGDRRADAAAADDERLHGRAQRSAVTSAGPPRGPLAGRRRSAPPRPRGGGRGRRWVRRSATGAASA